MNFEKRRMQAKFSHDIFLHHTQVKLQTMAHNLYSTASFALKWCRNECLDVSVLDLSVTSLLDCFFRLREQSRQSTHTLLDFLRKTVFVYKHTFYSFSSFLIFWFQSNFLMWTDWTISCGMASLFRPSNLKASSNFKASSSSSKLNPNSLNASQCVLDLAS